MTSRNCKCNNVCIVEGVFGEICAEILDDHENAGLESTPASSLYGEGDAVSGKSPCEPIKIKSYTMSNANRMEVKLITWGATIVSIKCPDKYGETADVVLGFDDLESYLDPTINQFIGCVLGRCANRIKDGTFKIKDQEYFLTKNESNKHHLHGGTNGFGRRVWESHVEEGRHVVMSYLSQDGEENYPGAVLVTLKFRLTDDNRLTIGMRASTSKPTVVNLSHGSLFNLAGHDAGEEELRSHSISLNCDRWTVAEHEDNSGPCVRRVGGTIMDLRIPRTIGDVLEKVPSGKGFDHNFCVIRSSPPDISFVARALHPKSGRFLEVYSDQPGVQFYTGGRLPPCISLIIESPEDESSSNEAYACADPCDCATESSSTTTGISRLSACKTLDHLPGKAGAKYKTFGAFGLQPQNYPNAVNVPKFPCAILRPGQVYYHDLVYKFGVQLCDYL